jgi:hypothetical protein
MRPADWHHQRLLKIMMKRMKMCTRISSGSRHGRRLMALKQESPSQIFKMRWRNHISSSSTTSEPNSSAFRFPSPFLFFPLFPCVLVTGQVPFFQKVFCHGTFFFSAGRFTIHSLLLKHSLATLDVRSLTTIVQPSFQQIHSSQPSCLSPATELCH